MRRLDGAQPVEGQEVGSECVDTHSSGISCPACGTEFMRARPWQRFCSPECRAIDRRLRDEDRLADLLARLPEDPGRPE